MSEALVIIGNGMAAARLAAGLLQGGHRYDITVIGDEPGLAYNRIALSSVLARETGWEGACLKPEAWWRSNGIRLITGVGAAAVDTAAAAVTLSDARVVPYAKLVFATGSQAVRLPIEGAGLPQVTVFRTSDDVNRMMRLAAAKKAVAVIGGGLLGIEAAYGLAKTGARVTLIHIMDRLMERQLDLEAAGLVKAALERKGVTVLLDTKTDRILGDTRVEGLRFADGQTIDADAIVMAAGVKPNADLARAAGIHVNRGIVADARLRTSTPGIYAIGECAEIGGECCGLVEPAYAHADVLARILNGGEEARYAPVTPGTNLKVSGLPVFSAGDFMGEAGSSAIVLRDPEAGLYKKFVTRDGVLSGAVLVGGTGDAAFYLGLIRERTPIAAIRPWLAFGERYCTPAAPSAYKIAA